MSDTRTPEQRRRIMQAVKTKNTGPEWIVRRLLHRLGYRYRLHVSDPAWRHAAVDGQLIAWCIGAPR